MTRLRSLRRWRCSRTGAALTHDAEADASTARLMARSGHTSNRSLARYASVTGEARQRWQEDRRPRTPRLSEPRLVSRALFAAFPWLVWRCTQVTGRGYGTGVRGL
jgi:hypothetical protein